MDEKRSSPNITSSRRQQRQNEQNVDETIVSSMS